MKPIAKTFEFTNYSFNKKTKRILFNYKIEFKNEKPLLFTETIILPKVPRDLPDSAVKSTLTALHFVLGISYYKLYCPPKIRLKNAISKEQAEFWTDLYKKGLGEFLYRNKLRPEKIARFPYSKKTVSVPERFEIKDRILAGIGGGKDSIVVSELLKNFDTTSFLVETQKKDELSRAVIKAIGNPSVAIQRILDPKIFLSYEGSFNGHVPVSAVFAFLGVLSAVFYGYKYVVVGNEASSNVGNARYLGMDINHQWSKSLEAERMIREYTKKYISPDVIYFSLLRPFYEIRIVKMFSKYKKYFNVFSSCNKNFKVHKERGNSLWCGECPKCAFIFLLLSAFLKRAEVIHIFKKNLFADEALAPLFADILGFGKMKPFDCVGTFEESQAALFLASGKFKNDFIVRKFIGKIKNPEATVKKVMRTESVPDMPTEFRFLGMEKVCIMGYGLEGKISERYVKERYPDIEIGICDGSLDKNYLDLQEQYDFAIKTPGISKTKMRIPYTTATNIFFAENKNFKIGITGSKGKSTTSTLIYEIIKASGKKVRFFGNIGTPMLQTVFEKVSPNEIFVLELSSYMLDDIEYSPNIALLLNLFPEHMDYHGGVENYYAAKKKIFAFQKPWDIAVKQPFNDKLPLKRNEIPLLGPHNVKNLQAAVKVVRLLGVQDSAIRKAVIKFKPLPHRLEPVGVFKGIAFYDDAISTTPQSAMMAIKAIKKVDTIFLGGEDRGYDFRELEKMLRAKKIRNIVLFPDSGKRILKSRKGFNVFETKSMKSAVEFAFKNTAKGKVCLLSTASPSYSLWKNFEAKGDEFQKWVKSGI